MTEEEAQTAADTQNAFLDGESITDQEYKILETFTQNYASNWRLCLVPTSHDAKYTAATAAQLAAFARVYQVTINSGQGIGTGYVTAYDANAELDPVLGPYLP